MVLISQKHICLESVLLTAFTFGSRPLSMSATFLSSSLWNVKRKRFTVMPTLCHPRALSPHPLQDIVVKWRKYFSNANFRYARRVEHEDIFDYCLPRGNAAKAKRAQNSNNVAAKLLPMTTTSTTTATATTMATTTTTTATRTTTGRQRQQRWGRRWWWQALPLLL